MTMLSRPSMIWAIDTAQISTVTGRMVSLNVDLSESLSLEHRHLQVMSMLSPFYRNFNCSRVMNYSHLHYLSAQTP